MRRGEEMKIRRRRGDDEEINCGRYTSQHARREERTGGSMGFSVAN